MMPNPIMHQIIPIAGSQAYGIHIKLQNAPLLMVIGTKGFIMCGYLDITAAEAKGDRAAVIKGVSTIEELLAGIIVKVSAAAREAGVLPGMTGSQAMDILA